MALAASEFQAPRTYTPEEVENIAFYQKAPMSDLVAVPKPAQQALATQAEVPQAIRETISRKLQKLGKEYGVEVSGDLEWERSNHEISVHYRSTDGVFLSMNFDPAGDHQVTFAYLAKLRLAEDSAPTPERFESHAVEFHQRAFGFPLPADRAGDDRIRLERFTGANTTHWQVIVNGAAMLREASIRAEQDPRNGSWTLSGSRGPTPSEVKAIEELLQKEPTKITEQEAMAIAWKNWKAVGKTLEDVFDYRIHCQLKEGSPAEIEPWEALPAHHYDAKAWKNAAAGSEPTDPVFYEVQIARNLSIASVLVDRINGKVIRIQQGRIGW
jgi:hypothetical protein